MKSNIKVDWKAYNRHKKRDFIFNLIISLMLVVLKVLVAGFGGSIVIFAIASNVGRMPTFLDGLMLAGGAWMVYISLLKE